MSSQVENIPVHLCQCVCLWHCVCVCLSIQSAIMHVRIMNSVYFHCADYSIKNRSSGKVKWLKIDLFLFFLLRKSKHCSLPQNINITYTINFIVNQKHQHICFHGRNYPTHTHIPNNPLSIANTWNWWISANA